MCTERERERETFVSQGDGLVGGKAGFTDAKTVFISSAPMSNVLKCGSLPGGLVLGRQRTGNPWRNLAG